MNREAKEQEADTTEIDGLDLNDEETAAVLRENGLIDNDGNYVAEEDREEPADETTKEKTAEESPAGSEEDDVDPNATDKDKKEMTDEEKDLFKGAPKGFSRKIRNKTRQNKRLQRELDEAKQRLAELEESKKEEKPAKRERESFKSDADYIKYLSNESIEEISLTKEEENLRAGIEQAEYESLADEWNDKITDNFETEDEQKEYHEAITKLGDPNKVFDKRIIDYIFRSPDGPKIYKYFSERSSIIPSLNGMHDYDLSPMLQKISAYVNGEHTSSSESRDSKPKVTTKAKAPLGKLGSQSPGAIKTADGLSDEELVNGFMDGSVQL